MIGDGPVFRLRAASKTCRWYRILSAYKVLRGVVALTNLPANDTGIQVCPHSLILHHRHTVRTYEELFADGVNPNPPSASPHRIPQMGLCIGGIIVGVAELVNAVVEHLSGLARLLPLGHGDRLADAGTVRPYFREQTDPSLAGVRIDGWRGFPPNP